MIYQPPCQSWLLLKYRIVWLDFCHQMYTYLIFRNGMQHYFPWKVTAECAGIHLKKERKSLLQLLEYVNITSFILAGSRHSNFNDLQLQLAGLVLMLWQNWQFPFLPDNSVYPEHYIAFMYGPKVKTFCIPEDFTENCEWADLERRKEWNGPF